MIKTSRQKKLSEIINAIEHIKKAFSKKMCHFGLSPVKFHTLMIIKHEKNVSQKNIVDALEITPSAVTQILDELEKDKYIQRLHDAKDKRKIIVTISKNGKKKLHDRWQNMHAKIDQMVDIFTDHELEVMVKIYKKLEKNINCKIGD